MWRKRVPSGIFLGRYVAQLPTQMRNRDRTGAVGAVISIMRLHQAMLQMVTLRAARSLHLRVSRMSGGRRQPRAPTCKKPTCRMELRWPVNQAWLPVRLRQIAGTSMSPVFRQEPQSKILTPAKFSLRRRTIANSGRVNGSTSEIRSTPRITISFGFG